MSKGRAVPGIVLAERILASPCGGLGRSIVTGRVREKAITDHPKAKFGAGRRLPERG